ncbi:hypothetical protein PGT21_014678 [Puccinia graminis f. sp. tritici]|uniref:Uncharacterized protein n=1 Tax=Puccinia graminis f. sp. tritici TaxID=56615 RepID=A0A5B0LW68_PUCGR|nr:hypothetical protein PGT21_014678 [Puccinia graminis f. sp. tritici]
MGRRPPRRAVIGKGSTASGQAGIPRPSSLLPITTQPPGGTLSYRKKRLLLGEAVGQLGVSTDRWSTVYRLPRRPFNLADLGRLPEKTTDDLRRSWMLSYAVVGPRREESRPADGLQQSPLFSSPAGWVVIRVPNNIGPVFLRSTSFSSSGLQYLQS